MPTGSLAAASKCKLDQKVDKRSQYNEESFKRSRRALSNKTAVQFLCLQALRWASEKIGEDLFDGRGKTAVDVGSAYGYVPSMLSKLLYYAVALDISSYALMAGERMSRIQADAQNLPLRSDSVDIITCFDTMEHLDQPLMLFKEGYRCLRRGGVLLLENPVGNPIDVVSDKLHRMAEIHCSVLAPNELLSLVQKTGFRIAEKGLLPIPFQRFPVYGRFVEIRAPLPLARRLLVVATKC